ncbi:MAG TPA: YcaO-like family protein [Chthoniobacterales bacterium]|nr:YcaO-like family protein [Chthoniobacterales bacterium]
MSPRFGIVKELKLFVPDSSEPPQPYVVQSVLGNHRYQEKDEQLKNSASGKGFTVARAREGALGEAVERYSSLFWWPEELTFSRHGDLPGRAIDPRALVLYRPEQYAQVDYAPYAEESELGWVAARSLLHDAPVWVPAMAVFLSYVARAPHEHLFGVNSNGVATGGTLSDAIYRGALEVVERDAFLLGWMHRLVAARWEPATHPDPAFRCLVETYRRRRIRVGLFQMPTDLDVAVFLAVGMTEDSEQLPAAVAGLGADPDPAAAAWKAFLEVGQIRPALRRRLRTPEDHGRMLQLFADPTLVKELDDHDLLYAHPGALGKLDFLWDTPVTQSVWPAQAEAHHLAWLTDHLGQRGHELIYYNLTPHDMKRLGLFTARALIPGFQPIDFGYFEMRKGGERLHRLPFDLGLRDEPAVVGSLNPDPHPIA